MNDKKGKGQFRRKPYEDKKKASGGKKSSGGGSSTLLKCYRCGVKGHRAYDCGRMLERML